MELLGDMVGAMLKNCIAHEGECSEHGKQTVYMPKSAVGYAWGCPVCLAKEAKMQAEQQWLIDRQASLHKIACIPSKYQGARFVATTDEQKFVRGTVRAFRDALTGKRRWAVLVLFGGVGTGKTLLASELGESLINNLNMSVRYCTAKQMIAEIQASYGMEGKNEEGEILRFVQYDLLMLDEMDAKPDRENANLLLTEIINRRYNEEKPVVVITNQPFDSLAQFVGDRVDDRLHENAYVCSFNWPSFRRMRE